MAVATYKAAAPWITRALPDEAPSLANETDALAWLTAISAIERAIRERSEPGMSASTPQKTDLLTP